MTDREDPGLPENKPDDSDTPDEQGAFLVRDLIFSLAETAKQVAKTYGIPINSAVELVKLGVGYHIANINAGTSFDEPDTQEPANDNVVQLPLPDQE